MSGHNALLQNFQADPLVDPGSGGSIAVDRSPCYVPLVSLAAETRTLQRPTRVGAIAILSMQTDGGDITITVTGGINENDDATIVFSDAGQVVVLVSCYDGTNYFWRKIADHLTANGSVAEVVTATNALTEGESGKTLYLSAAAGFTTTLPLPKAGLYFRFIVKTAPTGAAYIIVTNGSANIMYGMVLERAGAAGVAGVARDTFNFVAGSSIIGDWVEFESDGTNWYYRGMTDVAAGSTVAAT